MSNQCPNCGGEIQGDGNTLVLHCEYVSEYEYMYCEPDSDTVLCDLDEDQYNLGKNNETKI